MAELAAVGPRDFVVALAGTGAEQVECETLQEFEEALRRLALRRDLRAVFAAEPQAGQAPQAVAAFRRRSEAALLALPLAPSEEHPSLQEVRYLISQATGASLI